MGVWTSFFASQCQELHCLYVYVYMAEPNQSTLAMLGPKCLI